MDNSNWRNDEARQKIVAKIMDTLHRHMPQTGIDGMQELKKIAIRFEEKIFSSAQSQQDYLRRISLKMLSLKTKASNSTQFQTNAGQRGLDQHGQMMLQQPAMRNQSQQLPSGLLLPTQPPSQQPLMQQNLQSNVTASGIASSTVLAPSLNTVGNLSQSSNPNMGGQGSGLQPMQGITHSSMNNTSGQAFTQNSILASRQIQGRSQQHPQQSMPPQNLQSQTQQQQMFFKPQSALMQQKNPQYQMQSSMLHQQQSALSQNQLLQSQQPIFQPTQQPPLQSTQSSIPQQSQSSLMQPVQQNVYQQTQQHNSQQASQSVLQHQLIRHQQQQQQHSVLQPQQQPSMVQQSMVSTQLQHQTLLPAQTNVTSFQQHPHSIQKLLQAKSQQTQQGSSSLLQQSQSQQLQQQLQQQQLLPQIQTQAQPIQPQQQQLMQQSNTMQHDLPQTMQGSGGLLQQQPQNNIDQQNQIMHKRVMSEASSTSLESSSQAGQPVISEVQERLYQKMQILKEKYFAELRDLYSKINFRSQGPMTSEQVDKFKSYKIQIHKLLQYLTAAKGAFPTNFKEEHIDVFEKRIPELLNSFKPKPLQPGQRQIQNQNVSQVQSMPPQSQPQMQQQDKQTNPFQQMNMQPSIPAMQLSNMTPVQQTSMPLLQQSIRTPQQAVRSGIQPSPTNNASQGANVGVLQQSSVNALSHNTLQQNSISAIQQSGINSLPSNLNSLQSSSGSMHAHHSQIKQQELQAQQLKLQQRQFLQQQQQQQLQMQQKQHETVPVLLQSLAIGCVFISLGCCLGFVLLSLV